MTNLTRFVLVCLSLLASTAARADDLRSDRNDSRVITRIDRGVWELDVGALGVLTSDSENGASVTRLSSVTTAGVHYFVRSNVSVGVEGLLAYESTGDGTSAITYGAAVDAAIHMRLGLGAFFRPGIAVGVLGGNRDVTMSDGTIMQAPQVGVLTRVRLPIAYFASRSFLLEAGPEFDVTVGSYTPQGGDSQAFTHIAGGFSVGMGYAF